MEERMEMAGLVNRSKSVDVAAAALTLLLLLHRPCTLPLTHQKRRRNHHRKKLLLMLLLLSLPLLITKFVEQKFNVNVDDVLIRPLGHAFSAQVHVALDPNLTLKEAYEILTKINAAVSERFKTEETTVIPRPT
jgi:zinc transporter family protein